MVNQDKLTNAIVEFLQCNLAFEQSNQEGSNDPGEGHCDCGGHSCNCPSSDQGYDGPGRPRHDRSSKRQIETTARTKFRHDRSRSGVCI